MAVALAALSTLLLFAAHCSANVLIVDSSKEGSYLQAATAPVQLVDGEASLSSVTSALLGLLPPHLVDQPAAQAIGHLVKPSALKKPRALVVVNIAGLSHGDAVSIFNDKLHRTVEVSGNVASIHANAVAAMAQANPDVGVIFLDQKALQRCQNNCIEEHLPAAAESFGAQLSGSALTFASGAALDLEKLPDKLFAVEVASLWGGLHDQLVLQHEQADAQQQDVQVYELTLLGLQGLAAAYGAGSKELVAATNAVKSLLASAVASLDKAFSRDLVYQVATFDGVSAKDGRVESIMQWKQAARTHLAEVAHRSLAADSAMPTATAAPAPFVRGAWPPVDEKMAAKMFTSKACAYGGFILLVYFTMAAIWCMCNMPMQVDTLLFGSKKTD